MNSNNELAGELCITVGMDAQAGPKFAIAIGHHARAKGIGAIAIGDHAFADGDGAVAIGDGVSANGPNKVMIGIVGDMDREHLKTLCNGNVRNNTISALCLALLNILEKSEESQSSP